MKRKRIYLDNTATTRTRNEVITAINRYFKKIYGNPSSIHTAGNIARGSIEMARERIAGALDSSSDEIFFTGSGSESNNLAIRGTVKMFGKEKNIISSQIEHSSMLETVKELERSGLEVRYIKVDKTGRYDIDDLERKMDDNTGLVALSYVNNEIGTVQDIRALTGAVKKRRALLHLDAVQALPYFTISAKNIGADLMSFSGHKIYAPKGIGVLFVRNGTPIAGTVTGGGQERGLRSGTENVPYIVGLSKAVWLNNREKARYVEKLTALRDMLIMGVLNSVKDAILTGHPSDRAPNHASFCFKGINGKMLVKKLSIHGIEASSGSACSSPKNEPSHVLAACGIDDEFIRGSLRLSLGKYNSRKDVLRLLAVLPEVLSVMRAIEVEYDNEGIFISQEEFRSKISSGESIQIVDIRDFSVPRQMIKGALRMPSFKIAKDFRKLNKDAETVIVCYQGDVLSPEIHEFLKGKGFKKIRVLKGGMFSYSGHAPY